MKSGFFGVIIVSLKNDATPELRAVGRRRLAGNFNHKGTDNFVIGQ
jgi:hypothetical protein